VARVNGDRVANGLPRLTPDGTLLDIARQRYEVIAAMNQAPLVLVVEDDPGTADLLQDLLTDAGYRVLCLDSALGVHATVRRLHPAAVVLDLALPYRSGGSLLGDLKADPATAPVPVIVVSAHTEALPSPLAALAAAVIAKPFDATGLLAALRRAQ
jgi:DNA-binding response OmpR family regulator